MTATANPEIAGAGVFRYGDFDLDAGSRTLTCSYEVGGRRFEERVVLDEGEVDTPGVEAAARLVFMLAGVSYFKAFAPPVIDLGDHEVTPSLRGFLRDFYVHGLGEFAYRNDLDLHGLEIVGGRDVTPHASSSSSPTAPVARPLVPFGGGMDSIVSVEIVRAVTPDAALFVASQSGTRFDAIETAAAATGLPIVRATRELDPAILRSREFGFLNGHVPVTGILSAVALLAATMTGRDAVVMSNEWSASAGNVERDGHVVNHQWSKSVSFERDFRAVVREAMGTTPDYFSLLRPFSELWIARELASWPAYLPVFRSCNRAFHVDPAQRLDHWCGQCDKCVFIDLILSPFVDRATLAAVFDGHEPLDDNSLLESFRTLLGTGAGPKPFECVGDEEECRVAVLLAAARHDRTESPVLDALHGDIAARTTTTVEAGDRLLSPIGEHFVPPPYATALRLA